MRGRALLAALVLGLPLAACSSAGQGSASPAPASGSSAPATARTTFNNPVLGQGADPFLTVVDGR